FPAAQRRNMKRHGRDPVIKILSHTRGFDILNKFAASTTKEAATLGLLGVKIGVDNQLLEGKAQIRNLRQIDRPPRRKCRQKVLSIGSGAGNLRKVAAGPM